MSNFVTLLVEDDALQREVMADLLKDGGFEVVECTTAEAAELIVASTGAELQALVADQNLAGDMSGGDLARYARGRHPRLNIIVISGVTTCQHAQLSCKSLFPQRGCLRRCDVNRAERPNGNGGPPSAHHSSTILIRIHLLV